MNKTEEAKETFQQVKDIPEGQVFTIVATVVETMLAGAYKAGFKNNGEITLVYEDGEREIGKFTIAEAQDILEQGMKSFFPIVSSVQAQRTFKKVCDMMQGIKE